MKQEIITYLSTIKEELINLSQYIYNNPEESFKEYKCFNYIVNTLKNHNFNIEKNYLNIPTSFYAQIGHGYPKMCYLCEYDADPNHGHISGNNLMTTMSVGAAICLSKVIDKTSGTVVVIGCPGEYYNGTKTIMVKQSTFKDIDAVLVAHPNTITTKTLKSKAMLPLKVKFSIPRDRDFSLIPCTVTHCGMLTYTFTNILKDNLPKEFDIQVINSKSNCNPYLITSECEIDYLISSHTLKANEKIKDFLKSFITCIGNIFDLDTEINIYSLPYEEMLPNETLCRIFSHNLKESGIIYVDDFNNTLPGLSLGSVSHVVPCINPFVKITENPNIQYPSKSFAIETLKPYAIEQIFKTISALSITGLDLIQNKNLLAQVKQDLQKQLK